VIAWPFIWAALALLAIPVLGEALSTPPAKTTDRSTNA
jgi:hypothetical protein